MAVSKGVGDAAASTMPDLVEPNVTADRPGVKFVGDITYSHTWQGPSLCDGDRLLLQESGGLVYR